MVTSGPPDLSVCIPAYARPEGLRRAIESALGQSVPRIEVIVSDDSGDLEAVAGEFGDDRVRYFRNTVNLGMAGNFMAALDRATGRVRGLLNDDDVLLPGFADALLAPLEADPKVGVAFSNVLVGHGDSWRSWPLPLSGGTHADFLETLLRQMPVRCSAALI